jgi:tetratricopeptide (TPR) repeat protein
MITPLRFVVSGLTALQLANVKAAVADDTAWRPCKEAISPQEKVEACSRTISQTRDKRLLERARNRRGLAYVALGQFDHAIEDFSQVIRLNDKIAGYFDNRLNAYRLKGDAVSALKDADSAVRLAPTYTFVYRSRALVLGDLDRFSDGIDELTKAIQINSHDAGLFMDRGQMYAKHGNLPAAVNDFTNAIAIDPNLVNALKERGVAYMSLGDTEAALRDLNSYLLAAPSDATDLQEVRAMLKRE